MADERALIVRAGGRACALPVASVRETMRPLRTVALSGAPPWVLGVAQLRGQSAPVVDLGFVLTGRPSKIGRFVALELSGRPAALAVDAVIGVRSPPPREEVPPLLGEARRELVESLGRLDGELLLWLRPASIIPERAFEALEGTAP